MQPLTPAESVAAPTIYVGDRISLRPVTAADYQLLFEWRLLGKRHFLSSDKSTTTYPRFIEWFRTVHETGGAILVLDKNDLQPVGYGILYNANLWDGWAYIALFILPRFAYSRHFAEFVKFHSTFLFERHRFRKLYAEIYGDAERLLAHMLNNGWVEESVRRGHYSDGEKLVDLHTLALYPPTTENDR